MLTGHLHRIAPLNAMSSRAKLARAPLDAQRSSHTRKKAIAKATPSNNPRQVALRMAFAGLACAAGTASALEPGTSPTYPNGAESFMVAAVPPPGFYSLLYGVTYSADRMNDSRGNNLHIPDFKLRMDAVVARFVWVPGTKILGGDLAIHTMLPLMRLHGNVPGRSQTETGLGDIIIGAGLGFHHSPNLHSVVAIDTHWKTGDYDKNNLVNPGNNRNSIEPVYGLTYVDPKGFNGDLRVGMAFNQKNSATDYRSGYDIHMDYDAGWAISPQWVLGLGGYVYQQIGKDKQGGQSLADSKARAMAIGPILKFDGGNGWMFTVKWQKEFNVRNAPQGSGLYAKALLPF